MKEFKRMVGRGRTFDARWTEENVARIMKFNAGKGFVTNYDDARTLDYIRRCTAIYEPHRISLIYSHDKIAGTPMYRHLSLCSFDYEKEEFVDTPDALAQRWVAQFFSAEEIPRLKREEKMSKIGALKKVVHYFLEVQSW